FIPEYIDFDKGLFGIDRGVMKNLFFSVGSTLSSLRSTAPFLENAYYAMRQPIFARRRTKVRNVLRDRFDLPCPVEFVSHHYAHAASAYYASGYKDALVVTMDGAGDGDSAHVYHVQDGHWKLLHQVPAFDSLGSYYGYVTQVCGFTAGKHEGKITGLAAHGKETYRPILDRFIVYRDGTMRNVGNAFYQAAIKKLQEALPSPFDRADLAASIQAVSEDIATSFIGHWKRVTGAKNVALAGGLFANVKINQRIHEIPGVESVFVYPAMSDEGLAAGSALGVLAERAPGLRGGSRCFQHVYLGPEYTEAQISAALDTENVAYRRSDRVEEDIADLIVDGYVVARVNGRMEYGPRALGNRSILYRPDEPEVNDWLNKRLRRTEFMPFAPSTLAEEADRSFANLEGARDTARFMTITFDCSDEMKRLCPGVVHVDQTARPQLVSEKDNPSYYKIIRAFKERTGLTSIVNTSFNIHEEPIVCTPEDAIRAFKIGHLDILAMGPFIAKHPEADQRVQAAKEGRAAP
ncbi:MAG TPA: carbamoyltransferase C-terminal domain-containing protein, partial [Candidatus Eisenbacteria bacterium]|nr:carbamoyltransferase C-terminal domain-containing protein [Candidatus Eisenbacteria bacterium]